MHGDELQDHGPDLAGFDDQLRSRGCTDIGEFDLEWQRMKKARRTMIVWTATTTLRTLSVRLP